MLFPAAKVLILHSDTVFVATCDLDLHLYFYLFNSGEHHNSSVGFLRFGMDFFFHPTQICVFGTHRKGLTSIFIFWDESIESL